MRDVALVTFAGFPDGYEDDHLLAGALTRRDLTVEFVCWDDPDARWPAARIAVVRSTWDYFGRVDAFCDWADYVGSVTALRNDARTIRWNSHKRYLLDLAEHGVPIVPTTLVSAGETATLGSGLYVVKPAVSGGAERTTRFASQADLEELAATDDVLVQPYLDVIESFGELSIVCIAGTPSHVVRKVPATGDFRTQEQHGAEVTTIELTDAHRAIASAAFDALGALGLDANPLYARVDAVEVGDELQIMELELIEPTLWLAWYPPAADLLAASIETQLTHLP